MKRKTMIAGKLFAWQEALFFIKKRGVQNYELLSSFLFLEFRRNILCQCSSSHKDGESKETDSEC